MVKRNMNFIKLSSDDTIRQVLGDKLFWKLFWNLGVSDDLLVAHCVADCSYMKHESSRIVYRERKSCWIHLSQFTVELHCRIRLSCY